MSKRVCSNETPGKKKAKKDPACRAVFEKLQAFEAASDETRSQTYTRGIEKLLQDTPYTEDIQEILLKGSNVTGLLIHLATIYLNLKADQDHTFPGLLDKNYYTYIMNKIAGRAVTTQYEDPFLEQYLNDHCLPQELQADIDEWFLFRPIEHAAKQMVISAEQHLHSNFEDRVIAVINLQLEIMQWSKRSIENFNDIVKRLSKAVFKAAVADDQETSEQTVMSVCEGLDDDWDVSVFIMNEWSDLLSPLRERRGRATNGTHESPRKAYLYNVKVPAKTLPILARIRGDGVEYRNARGAIWQSINQQRPSLPSAFSHEDVFKVKDRLMTRLDWCLDRGTSPLTVVESLEYKRAKAEVQDTRKQLWQDLQQPGTMNPPRGFTLLPKYPLKPAFMKICDRTVGSIIERIHLKLRQAAAEKHSRRVEQGLTTAQKVPSVSRPIRGGRDDRLWFNGIFQLYPGEKTPHPTVARSDRNKKQKMLKNKKANVQKGLRILKGEEWVLDDAEFEHRKAIPDQRPPHLVNAIMTNGLQVQVTLCSRGDNDQTTGLEHLHKAGYSHITETFDVTKHYRGIFKDAAPIPTELLDILDQKDPNCFVETVGNDPGGKFLSTISRARLTRSITHADFKAPPGFAHAKVEGQATMPTSFSATEYRYRTLAKRAQRYEMERMEASPSLRQAREAFLDVSL
jgi:hypothetical protein